MSVSIHQQIISNMLLNKTNAQTEAVSKHTSFSVQAPPHLLCTFLTTQAECNFLSVSDLRPTPCCRVGAWKTEPKQGFD